MEKKRVNLGSMVLGAVLVLVVFAGEVRAEENLLKNPGFEESASKAISWNAKNFWFEKPKGSGISRVVIDNAIAHSGRNSLNIIGENNRAFVRQRISAKAGFRYQVSGWIKTEDLDCAAQINVAERKKLPKGTEYLKGTQVGILSGTADWKQFTKEFTATQETDHIVVNFYTEKANNGTVWFDDISVVEMGEIVEVKKEEKTIQAVSQSAVLKEIPDLNRVLFLENTYGIKGKWIVEIPLLRLDIPEGMNIAAVTAQEQDTSEKIQTQIEDDNLNGKIEREDLLLLEVKMEKDEREKVLLLNISSKPEAGKEPLSLVKIQKHPFYYEVKAGKVLAEFSRKNGALNSLKYNTQIPI